MSLFDRLWSAFFKRLASPAEMIGCLLDKSQDLGSRDDIAMDLYASDLPEAEAALLAVASDPAEEEMIIDSAGESLAQIYKRQNRELSAEALARLQPSARKFFQPPGV